MCEGNPDAKFWAMVVEEAFSEIKQVIYTSHMNLCVCFISGVDPGGGHRGQLTPPPPTSSTSQLACPSSPPTSVAIIIACAV